MKLHFAKLLDAFFPPTDDELLIRGLHSADFQHKLAPQTVAGTIALSHFSDEAVRAAIHLVKFHNHAHARRLLSALLAEYLQIFTKENSILIPVPLSRARHRARGYNQIGMVAVDALAETPHITYMDKLVVRTRDTKPQTKLSREERLVNVANAFGVRNHILATDTLKGRSVIILDDVVTTGATLNAVQTALKPYNPASITCVALAH